MADYFVSSTGSNTSPYDTWAKAATSFATAIAAASTNGDRVIVQYNEDIGLTADTTFTFVANIQVISSTNSGTATITPTAMGTSGAIGNVTTTWSIQMAGAVDVHFWGITFRIPGTGGKHIFLATTDDSHFTYESCRFDVLTTATVARIYGTTGGGNVEAKAVVKNSVFRFGATAQSIAVTQQLELIACSVDSAGSAPSSLFTTLASIGKAEIIATGCDFSHITGTILTSATTNVVNAVLSNCKFGSGVTPLAYTRTNQSGGDVMMFNCGVGDVHYGFWHMSPLGQTKAVTTPYANDGALYDGTNHVTWKVDTTNNCGLSNPYTTPWFETYNSDVATSITPYLEILRDGSATAYTDAEVWGEFLAQTNSGGPDSDLYSDRATLGAAGASQTAGVGLSGWTGENATAWSGKVDSGSAFTPAEIGMIRARVCLVVNTDTTPLYIDPKIRT